MRYAIFADIHGNLEALEEALACAQRRRLSHFLVLGDSLGYGANPNECLEWALGNASLNVLGNHEAALFRKEIRERFNGWARDAIDWTEVRLKQTLLDAIRELPYIQFHGNIALAHGTLHCPEEFHYLLDEGGAYRSFLATPSLFGFVGHTHVPSFFAEKSKAGGVLAEGVLKLKAGERYLLNPGSVGQPRDGDLRLSFGIFDEDELTFEIVRLPYDNKKAAGKILAEGLPAFLARRLL